MENKSLVMYDMEGYIISPLMMDTDVREPVSVPFMWVEIPTRK